MWPAHDLTWCNNSPSMHGRYIRHSWWWLKKTAGWKGGLVGSVLPSTVHCALTDVVFSRLLPLSAVLPHSSPLRIPKKMRYIHKVVTLQSYSRVCCIVCMCVLVAPLFLPLWGVAWAFREWGNRAGQSRCVHACVLMAVHGWCEMFVCTHDLH